jgi:hypothetical protein
VTKKADVFFPTRFPFWECEGILPRREDIRYPAQIRSEGDGNGGGVGPIDVPLLCCVTLMVHG